jgi:hypothetical protein
MTRPPVVLAFLAMFTIAAGETAGALMGWLRPAVESYARARVVANASVHGLAGSAEYDAEVTGRAVFGAEAGLSFFHTHAEGVGLIALLVGAAVATFVVSAPLRGGLYALLALASLFPWGYAVYSIAVLELGRDAGVELAERWVLTPLGSAAILALLGAAAALLAGRRAAAR